MPVSIYTGDEPFLLNQAVKALRSELVDPAMAAFSHRTLQDPKIHELLELLGAVSFNLGGTMLYEIQGFSFLHKAAGSNADEQQLESLKAILSELEESRHVLFVTEKINRTVKFPKALVKMPGVKVQEFKQLNFWEGDKAIQILMQQAKGMGIILQPQAATMLVENFGVSLQPLLTEMTKLSVYVGDKPITVDAVKTLSSHNENTFVMLGDWVRGNNAVKVLEILQELLLRQQPVQLFALVQTYLNNLFQLRLWQQSGISQAQMAEKTKKHPFRIKKDLEEFGRVPFERLAQLKTKALEYEHRSKTGDLPAQLALEMLLAS